jgi:prepilin peptidase CpaA
MERPPFFPDPAFGWTFYLIVVGITVLAAAIDLRKTIVPKWLSLAMLALGLLFNVVRGAWMGLGYPDGRVDKVWAFALNGPWIGGLDGFLFALSGFAAGFALFFVFWFLGTCGGGDVKLVAALGAWVGPLLVLYVTAGTLVLVVVLSVLYLLFRIGTSGFKETQKQFARKQGKRVRGGVADRPRQRLMTYSLPVALATAVILIWFFRFDLQLAPAPGTATNEVQANANL